MSLVLGDCPVIIDLAAAKIDYGFAEANTTAGLIGVKVWICKKDDYQPMKSNRGRRAHAPNA